jgi:hypothetical protein
VPCCCVGRRRDLGLRRGLHQQLHTKPGRLLRDLRQRTVLGEQSMDVVADTAGRRYSDRPVFPDGNSFTGRTAPTEHPTPGPGVTDKEPEGVAPPRQAEYVLRGNTLRRRLSGQMGGCGAAVK